VIAPSQQGRASLQRPSPDMCIMATAGLQLRPVGGVLHTRSAPQLTSAHPAARHATALLARSSPQTQLLKHKLHLVSAWPASATRSRLSARCKASNGAPSPPWKQKNARLVLEDGSVWHGVAFGATGQAVGEVVFNTSMSGYQVRGCQMVAHAVLMARSAMMLQQAGVCSDVLNSFLKTFSPECDTDSLHNGC
jgi:Carbamoyl-phosphate synthase small chain, CPSase domain